MADSALEAALEIKLKGNVLFKENNFEEAIKLYSQAIDACPKHRQAELAVMYQNRAASHERMERWAEATSDCDLSIKNNNKYGKALDRRSKLHRKQAHLQAGGEEGMKARICHLRKAMEDVSMVAQIEGFKHEQLLFVDEVLKQLGSALATEAGKCRPAVLPSAHTIQQYFTSFMDDPLFEKTEGTGPYSEAQAAYQAGDYDNIIPLCEKEVTEGGPNKVRARLLKATFLVLTKQLKLGLEELTSVVEEAGEDKKALVNALIKRGSLYIQRCHEPNEDADLSYKDFNRAQEADPNSADVLMNRGQISLLLDRFPEAVADLVKAAELRPDFALATVQKLYTDFLTAHAAGDKSGLEKVKEDFKASTTKFPDCVECYALYAKVLQETGDLEGADALYKKGVELNPANANLLVHRALLALQQTKNVNAAQEATEAALKVDDKCEFAWETLGQIQIQKDNMDEAVKAFDKAIPLVNTELEMAHLFGLSESAKAKSAARKKLAELPTGMQDMGLD